MLSHSTPHHQATDRPVDRVRPVAYRQLLVNVARPTTIAWQRSDPEKLIASDSASRSDNPAHAFGAVRSLMAGGCTSVSSIAVARAHTNIVREAAASQ